MVYMSILFYFFFFLHQLSLLYISANKLLTSSVLVTSPSLTISPVPPTLLFLFPFATNLKNYIY